MTSQSAAELRQLSVTRFIMCFRKSPDNIFDDRKHKYSPDKKSNGYFGNKTPNM